MNGPEKAVRPIRPTEYELHPYVLLNLLRGQLEPLFYVADHALDAGPRQNPTAHALAAGIRAFGRSYEHVREEVEEWVKTHGIEKIGSADWHVMLHESLDLKQLEVQALTELRDQIDAELVRRSRP